MKDCVDGRQGYILKKHLNTLKWNKAHRNLSNFPDKIPDTFSSSSKKWSLLRRLAFGKRLEVKIEVLPQVVRADQSQILEIQLQTFIASFSSSVPQVTTEFC